jgi:GT2 family glycosyltransferase
MKLGEKIEISHRAEERSSLKICLVSRDLYGWTESATAVRGVAQLFASLGDSVTVLWVPWKKQSSSEVQKLKESLYSTYLIRLEVLDESSALYLGGESRQASLAVYHYLKSNDFDLVYFSLEGGLAYYSLLSRETGVARFHAKLLVLASTPIAWSFEADKSFFSSPNQVATSHMERYCAQAADIVICGSNHMLSWLQKRAGGSAKWELLPPVMPSEPPLTNYQIETVERPVEEIVFFSGMEFRHGFSLLCQAIDLVATSPTRLTVTVLGPFGTVGGEHSGGMLLKYARRWPFTIKILNRLKDRERVQYLKERNCLAVIPSIAANSPLALLTCLDEGVPFVATDVGGTPEMIAKEDWGRCLCAPEAVELAAKIISALTQPFASIRARWSADQRRNAWAMHLLRLASPGEKTHKASGTHQHQDFPLVSVILVHHDRPSFLLQAVASVEQQDYPNLELIIVDDGSKLPASHTVLDQLESSFAGKKNRCRIVRRSGGYLGAARNAGVRDAAGGLILFLDDDNALFGDAVSTMVRAIETSGSDICLALYRTYYGPQLPADQELGSINYLPLGGSLDLAMFNNTIGDAGAMFRRNVFDKIGYQMEQHGVAGEDWEFFVRALFSGLKIRIIPEPLYWYRSNTEGMYRTSNWYDTRQAILNVFKKHNFAGVEDAFHMLIAQNVGAENKSLRLSGLQYSISNELHLDLAKLDPNSEKAVVLLAKIAASEGRSDTALTLLGQSENSDFARQAIDMLTVDNAAHQALVQLGAGFFKETTLNIQSLQGFAIREEQDGADPLNFYTEPPAKLFLEARDAAPTIAVLAAGCPSGTSSVSARIHMGEPIGEPIEFLMLIAPTDCDADVAVAQASRDAAEGSSGWTPVSQPGRRRQIKANLSLPSTQVMNLIVAVRQGTGRRRARALGAFDNISIRRALGWDAIRRPRLSAPRHRQRARIIGQNELGQAKLVTNHPSQLPQILVEPNGEGLFLRPNARGTVAAVLSSIFPPFAKKIIASVEIAHEEASAFDFAMVLTKPGESPNWKRDVSSQVVAFSGWHRVEEKFKHHEISVQVGERMRIPLSLELAIRLPHGSHPMPANTFWRKLVLVWEE